MLLNVVDRPPYPDVPYANIRAAMEEERQAREARLARLVGERPGVKALVREGSAN